jgi:hypothetical protein
MHGDPSVIQKIDNQNDSIHTIIDQNYKTLLLQMQNLIEPSWQQHFFHKKDRDGKTTRRHWCKTTLQSQMFSQLNKSL